MRWAALALFLFCSSANSADFYVDSSAAAGGNGSFATPWNDLGDITGMATGDDVWLKAGSVFDNQSLEVSWAGTSSNRAIVGCYYDNGGSPAVCTSFQTKPEIRGGIYSCKDTLCDWTDNVSQYTYQVNVLRDYVTLQDIHVCCSWGVNFHADGDYDADNTLTGLVVQRVRGSYSGFTNLIYEDGIENAIIKDSTFDHTGICHYQDGDGNSTCSLYNYFGETAAGYPAALTYSKGKDDGTQRGVIENNLVYNSAGEGINTNRSNRIITRSNRVGNTVSSSIYANQALNQVIEQNIVWGNPVNANAWLNRSGFANSLDGIKIGVEFCGSENPCAGGKHVIRNNVLYGAAGISVAPNGSPSSGVHSGKIYGNSIYANSPRGIDIDGTATTQGVWLVADNYVDADNLSASEICSAPSNAVFNNNGWSIQPTDSDCYDSLTDVVGESGVTASSAAALDADWADPPALLDVALPSSSQYIGAAADLSGDTLSELSSANWSGSFSLMDIGISQAQWEAALFADANESARPAAPTLGAVETSANQVETRLSASSTRLVHQVAWVQSPYSTHVGGATLSTGFCANDTELTNTDATYTITAENADGGEFRYFDGCGFTYTAGASSTSASFTYRLNDYDGAGNSVSYTVTVTVQ